MDYSNIHGLIIPTAPLHTHLSDNPYQIYSPEQKLATRPNSSYINSDLPSAVAARAAAPPFATPVKSLFEQYTPRRLEQNRKPGSFDRPPSTPHPNFRPGPKERYLAATQNKWKPLHRNYSCVDQPDRYDTSHVTVDSPLIKKVTTPSAFGRNAHRPILKPGAHSENRRFFDQPGTNPGIKRAAPSEENRDMQEELRQSMADDDDDDINSPLRAITGTVMSIFDSMPLWVKRVFGFFRRPQEQITAVETDMSGRKRQAISQRTMQGCRRKKTHTTPLRSMPGAFPSDNKYVSFSNELDFIDRSAMDIDDTMDVDPQPAVTSNHETRNPKTEYEAAAKIYCDAASRIYQEAAATVACDGTQPNRGTNVVNASNDGKFQKSSVEALTEKLLHDEIKLSAGWNERSERYVAQRMKLHQAPKTKTSDEASTRYPVEAPASKTSNEARTSKISNEARISKTFFKAPTSKTYVEASTSMASHEAKAVASGNAAPAQGRSNQYHPSSRSTGSTHPLKNTSDIVAPKFSNDRDKKVDDLCEKANERRVAFFKAIRERRNKKIFAARQAEKEIEDKIAAEAEDKRLAEEAKEQEAAKATAERQRKFDLMKAQGFALISAKAKEEEAQMAKATTEHWAALDKYNRTYREAEAENFHDAATQAAIYTNTAAPNIPAHNARHTAGQASMKVGDLHDSKFETTDAGTSEQKREASLERDLEGLKVQNEAEIFEIEDDDEESVDEYDGEESFADEDEGSFEDDGETAETEQDPLIRPLSQKWQDKINHIFTHKHRLEVVAKTVLGSELRRADLEKLLPSQEASAASGTASWLNDEAVNAWLAAIVSGKLEQSGYIKGQHVPKFVTYPSQWYTTYRSKGMKALANWSKRQKIAGVKLLSAERIFLPVNTGAHWILLIVSPLERKLEVLDSMDTSGGGSARWFAVLREWLAMELGEAGYAAEEWTEATARTGSRSSPQLNSSDCGVFVCVNALASAKALPFSAVRSEDGMLGARRMIVAVLLNEGFSGDWSL